MKVARHIIEARREAIAKLLSKVGYVPVLEICKQFNVSEATARRDQTSSIGLWGTHQSPILSRLWRVHQLDGQVWPLV